MATFIGHCHCHNLELTFETPHTLATLPLRACACEFCRRHGARTTSDPHGSVRIVVHDGAQLGRYRFGLATADALVCRRCGVYVGVVLATNDGTWATVNANTFAPMPTAAATPVDYAGETAAQRIARRRAAWTPCTLVVGVP